MSITAQAYWLASCTCDHSFLSGLSSISPDFLPCTGTQTETLDEHAAAWVDEEHGLALQLLGEQALDCRDAFVRVVGRRLHTLKAQRFSARPPASSR
jgi:hypothetical protein